MANATKPPTGGKPVGAQNDKSKTKKPYPKDDCPSSKTPLADKEQIRREVEAATAKEKAEYSPTVAPHVASIESCPDACAFIDMDLPKREWLIESLLYSGQLAMFYAKAGVGKTWFALDIAKAVSSGSTLFSGPTGKYQCAQAGVLYIDGEMPAIEMQQRLRSLDIPMGPSPLKLLSSELLSIEEKPIPNITTGEWRDSIKTFLRNHPEYKLLVVDNLSSLSPGKDESDKLDWDDINQWLIALRRLGVAVLVVHHAGKNGDQRGTSGREDQLDLILKLSAVEGRERPTVRAHFHKGRSLTGDQKKDFMFELASSSGGTISLTHRAVSEDITALVAFLAAKGWIQKDIAERAGINQSNVSRRVAQAKSNEWLIQTEKGFSLTALGKSVCEGVFEDE